MSQPTSSSLWPSTDHSEYVNRIILIRHAEKGFTPGQITGNASIPPPPQFPSSHRYLGYWSSIWTACNALWRVFGLGLGSPSAKRGVSSRGGGKRGRGGRGPPGRRGGPGGPRGPRGKFPDGLSDIGRERAQYIRTLFGKKSEFDFGLIFAAPFNTSEKATERTYATVAPLAEDLGLKIDIECANSELSCIAERIRQFAKTSDADILISWKHFYLNAIAQELGAKNARSIYPDDRNDVIWIMEHGRITEKRSMHCPGLDDGRVDEGDPDLVVEEKSAKVGDNSSWMSWMSSAVVSWLRF